VVGKALGHLKKGVKMKKIFIIMLGMVFCMGYSNKDINIIYYNLDISYYFQEKIDIVLQNNAYDIALQNKYDSSTNMEYSLLYENQEPIHSNHSYFYNKTIKNKKNFVLVSLNYNYKENDFINSNYIINCFEKYKINSTNDYLELSLSGKFYCLEDKTLKISISTKHPVLYSNGNKTKNKYLWEINQQNKNNTNIKYKIQRKYSDMDQVVYNEKKENNFWTILKNIIIIISVLSIIFIVYKKIKKKELIY